MAIKQNEKQKEVLRLATLAQDDNLLLVAQGDSFNSVLRMTACYRSLGMTINRRGWEEWRSQLQ
jgi:hypothetical protein